MFKSWAITVRPKHGLTDSHLSALEKFCNRSKFHLLGVESTDNSRHAHFGVFLDKPSTKANIANRLLSCPALKTLASDEVSVLRKGIKIMYNSDFIMGYIGDPDKLDDYTEVSRNLPDDIEDLDTFYPPVGDATARKPVSVWYSDRAADYEAKSGTMPATECSVLSFLKTLMFKEKVINIIADQRRLQQQVRSLVAYLNEDTSDLYLDPRLSTDEDMIIEKAQRCGHCRANILDTLCDMTN